MEWYSYLQEFNVLFMLLRIIQIITGKLLARKMMERFIMLKLFLTLK